MASKSLDGSLTKKAHKTEKFNEQHILDIQLCSDLNNGYLYFAKNFFHIQHPVKGKLLFQPFEYQHNLLHSYHDHIYSVNILPRQSGKCLEKNTMIKIKHATTGQEYELPIEDFFNMQRSNNTTRKSQNIHPSAD